mgnify:CR=1 FL=1
MAENFFNEAKQLPKKIKGFIDRIKISIQTKITIPYVILAIFIALGGSLLITQFTMRSIETRFNGSLVETSKISADMMVSEENLMLETLRLIAHTEAIDETIRSQDAERLREMIIPIAFNGIEDMIVVLDNTGTNLLTLENTVLNGKPTYEATRDNPAFSQLEMVQSVLTRQVDTSGNKFAGMVIINDRPTFFISGPVEDNNGDLAGVVMIGAYAENIIRTIRQETLAQVTLYDFSGNVLVSTLNEKGNLPPEVAYLAINNQDESSALHDYNYSDFQYREIVSPWEVREQKDIGLIGISFSTNFLSKAMNTSRWQVALFVLVLLIFTVFTGILIGRIITEPITKLKKAAAEVSEGDLTVQVKAGSHDELAVLADSFNDMVKSLKSSKGEIIEAYDRTLVGWTKALELKDRETKGHTQRVTRMTVEIAKSFGYQGESLEYIKRGAILHDIGKMGIPDSILKKPGALTPAEFEVIKRHPKYGFDVLSQITFLQRAIAIPYCHHERWDGTGYPRGLKGEDIPLSARIFAVVDVWDAVTSDRIYRKAMSEDEAIALIKSESGRYFDPRVVNVFLTSLKVKNSPSVTPMDTPQSSLMYEPDEDDGDFDYEKIHS